ncbi:MAG: ACT domain-containing protein [Clostridiales bacterium]|nr:ACT domain-containing protein [Candidatus Apopatocola equi]MCQ2438987.1 ACT domain-containing protein [Oscillospiraceae bacterium]
MNEVKAIVSVVGKDSVGIIAHVCTTLAENNINVLDISQTIMQGYFTMVMVVDISGCSIPFSQLAEELKLSGESKGLSIRIQREDIFDAMHKI